MKTIRFTETQIIKSWSMDFVSDSLMNGRKFHVLNVIDDYNREALSIDPYFSIPSEKIINTLELIIYDKGKPKQIRVDNGLEFISSKLSEWCNITGIKLHFIQPKKPTQNAYIKRTDLMQDLINKLQINFSILHNTIVTVY